ncbi:hypothetical protein CPB83DRAFT_861014 [Crepidotus variabilis]|uniref:MYND-type domain-containing protein n=1 Tax=Crepidotus variabilis TaxID=179855 RepID=A0A9P6JKX2_9AGAR|nr:hypothetical protein CPB83DRAFT_861014 [Crepidotus variabilis]
MPDEGKWDELERFGPARTKAAATLARIGSVDSAKEAYGKIVEDVLGAAFDPLTATQDGAVNPTYSELSQAHKADLMACFVGLAKCEAKIGNRYKALLWLEEVQLIYLNTRWADKPKLYDWMGWFPEDVAIAIQYSCSCSIASDILLGLMNTGSAVYRRYGPAEFLPNSVTSKEPAIEKSILSTRTLANLLGLRHPDPARIVDQKLVDSSLQVLGSWTKLKIRKSTSGPGRRMSFSGFLWEGQLYIAGGRKDSLGPFYRDIWSLDLSKLDSWKALPEYPQPMSKTSAFLGWQLLPHLGHKKAYLFTGRSSVDFYDLRTQAWGTISTKFHHAGQSDTAAGINSGSTPWPYPKGQLTDSAQQLAGNKLYVFGGTHGTTSIGCNLFVVLDLKTRTWRRLSGSVMPTKDSDPSIPGPRKTPCSWVDPTNDTFYLIGGECDRMGAKYSGEIHGGDHGHGFNDFWSWKSGGDCWKRERWVGNIPCPRSEAACVYNPKVNKTILWGGYNPNMPTAFPDHGVSFSFSYFADTFVYDGTPNTSESQLDTTSPQRWRQVITSSFPTYRAQSMLFADPISGRTFLYGGFSNNDYVPSRVSAISRSFGDVWELRIDVPQGGFTADDGSSKVDFEAERRSARVGPWQRCFACGSAGEWKKCGGSCRGRVFFCDQECLREGWKEHKAAHGCKKV